MRVRAIKTWALRGLEVGWFTIGYRRQWLRHSFYTVRNYGEHSAYAGFGPVYLRLRWKQDKWQR